MNSFNCWMVMINLKEPNKLTNSLSGETKRGKKEHSGCIVHHEEHLSLSFKFLGGGIKNLK